MPEEVPDLLALYQERLASLSAKSLSKGLTPQESLEISALNHAVKYLSASPQQENKYTGGLQKQDLFRIYLEEAGRPTHAGEMCRFIARQQPRWSFRDMWQGVNNSIRKELLVVFSGEGGDKVVGLPEWKRKPSGKR